MAEPIFLNLFILYGAQTKKNLLRHNTNKKAIRNKNTESKFYQANSGTKVYGRELNVNCHLSVS